MAKEFSLDDADFTQKEAMDIEQLPTIKPSSTVAVESMGFFQGNSVDQHETESTVMDVESEEEEEEEISSKKRVFYCFIYLFLSRFHNYF